MKIKNITTKKDNISKSFREIKKKDEILISSSSTSRTNRNHSYIGYLGMNGEPNLFNKNYTNSYLSDLKKTFNLNIDILKQYIKSNNNPINNDNKIITLLNSINENNKKKQKIIENIKQKKSKLLIDNQINSEKKRKNEEKRFYLIDKINENEERINLKEEYMKVLHKKMREVEIYIHKNTLNVKDIEKRKKYQIFSMFDFIETNNDLIKQKKDLNKQIETNKNNYQIELEENKKIKDEEQKEKMYNKKDNDEESKIKKLSEKYKKTIKLMSLRLNMLKNTYKKISKKIKILKIGEFKQLDNNNNINNNKEDDKIDNEQTKINLDTTFKNSFMDFSIILNKNFEESKFDISKIGNNFGNVSNFGIYDISIINYK